MIYHIKIILFVDRFNNWPEYRIYSVFCLEYETDIFIKEELVLQKLTPTLDKINLKTFIGDVVIETLSLTEEEFFYIKMKYPNCSFNYKVEEIDDV